MKYDYIFFDFNGTILDDVDLCLKLLNTMLINKGLKSFEKENYKEIFTFPIIQYYRNAGFTFEGYTFEELSQWFILNYQAASLNCHLYPNVINLIKELKLKGYKIILLSASKIENLIEQTNHFNITSYFDDILGLDNFHAYSKEQIAIEYIKNKRIDPKRCLFIGDSTHDYEVASKVGGDAILVTYGHQSKKVLSQTNCPLIDEIIKVREFL
ncbi:MAG: HAD family hydrolase [Bacillales bacterium]|nr:HAD family hydrolase [Bacillales bacterium]